MNECNKTQTTTQLLTGFGVRAGLRLDQRRFYSHTCGGILGHDCSAFTIGALNGASGVTTGPQCQ